MTGKIVCPGIFILNCKEDAQLSSQRRTKWVYNVVNMFCRRRGQDIFMNLLILETGGGSPEDKELTGRENRYKVIGF
jgi:hypothetical protein